MKIFEYLSFIWCIHVCSNNYFLFNFQTPPNLQNFNIKSQIENFKTWKKISSFFVAFCN